MDEDTIDEHTLSLYAQEEVEDGDNVLVEEPSEKTAATKLANENNGDDDYDMDGSSVGSFSSTDSGSSFLTMGSTSSEASLTLMKRQARNVI